MLAMFRSIEFESSRKRIYGKELKLLLVNDESTLEHKATEFSEFLSKKFDMSRVCILFDYLFNIPKKIIIRLRDLSFKLAFSDIFII